MTKNIIIGNIPIELERKKIKNMYLRILPPKGQVRITAPLRMSEEEIRKFVLSKLDWIHTQQQAVIDRHLEEDINYVDGDAIPFWGEDYTLQIQEKNGRSKLVVEEGLLKLTIRPEATKEQRKKMIDSLYKENLNHEIPRLMARWESTIGVKSTGFSIRDMKTRWGTCNVRTKKICLSLQLAKKHPKCLEYVVVHELVHLLERSHNHVFKAYLDHFLPGWRQIKQEMNGKKTS
jgi:predicted metal-dependent hydrolase